MSRLSMLPQSPPSSPPPASRPAAPRAARGFTLIELMVVIVILGMLVALVGPNVWHALVTGNKGAAETQMSNIQQAIEMYMLDHKTLPDSLDNLTEPAKNSGEPYMKEIPNDPWGEKYDYKIVNRNRREFEIRSAGEDKMWSTEDDLVWPKKSDSSK